MEELLYKDITFEIRGACFWVWKEFKGAFKEKIVDRALTVELKKRGRNVEDQKRLDISYQGVKVGTYVPDKIVDGKVLVELKCKSFLTEADIDQFWKYLRGSQYKVGLLINFGPKNLEIKRLVYDTARVYKDLRPDQRNISALKSAEKGFTLMEIIVSTALFAIVMTMTMVLFTYTLKINRRVETLREAVQGSRNFVELLVRDIRNGTIDYSGQVDPVHCPASYNPGGDAYLAIVTLSGDKECFYYPAGQTNPQLYLTKNGITEQFYGDSGFKLTNAIFYVRPSTNPAIQVGGFYPGIQPFVTMVFAFTSQLSPSAAQFVIPYQTTVSTDIYSILHK